MAIEREKMQLLRKRITEGLRIQRDSRDAVPYIDVSNVLGDVSARQNHAIFARRGCGKTLLLHHSSTSVDDDVRSVYLNCEDFKRHSFPNVLIEILDALFGELESHLSGWFGKKRASRELIQNIRKDLQRLRETADTQQRNVRELIRAESVREATCLSELGILWPLRQLRPREQIKMRQRPKVASFCTATSFGSWIRGFQG